MVKETLIGLTIRPLGRTNLVESEIKEKVTDYLLGIGEHLFFFPPKFSFFAGDSELKLVEFEVVLTSRPKSDPDRELSAADFSITYQDDSSRVQKRDVDNPQREIGSSIERAFIKSQYPSKDHSQNLVLEARWNSLFFERGKKSIVESYIQTLVDLRRKNIDSATRTRISLNQAILLFGPPGTGKTCMAEGLATILARKLGLDPFSPLEIFRFNVSAFSSYRLGETQKIVQQALQTVRLSARKGPVLCILDEVESIAFDRTRIEGAPPDSVIAVNVLLNEFDRLTAEPNVFIFMTSNLTEKIDSALLDRCDLRLEIPLPSKEIAKEIIGDTINYMKVVATYQAIDDYSPLVGLSGRAIRKVPIVMYSLFLSEAESASGNKGEEKPVIDAKYIKKAVEIVKRMNL